jgi:hypothetical protein
MSTATVASATPRLTPAERAAYAKDGIVIPETRLSPAAVGRLREALDQLIADNPDRRPEQLVNAHLRKGPEGIRGSDVFLDMARDPAIVDLVAALVGPDVILWGCQVFCKPGGDGLETPFHQDGHYWPIRPLANCTVWVALEESTVENGCLRVIPRSHARRRLHDHLHEDRTDLTLNQRLAHVDEAAAVDIELQPGEMSLHDVYMIHGARANTSGKRRTGAALRYMPSTSVFERDLRPVDGKSGVPVNFARRPLWLVKGMDRAGRNDFKIGHNQ